MDILTKDAKGMKIKQHINQLKSIIRANLNKFALKFLDEDPDKIGYINQNTYQKILKSFKIPEKVMSEKDLRQIFNEYKDNDKFDYKSFIQDLKENKTDKAKNYYVSYNNKKIN